MGKPNDEQEMGIIPRLCNHLFQRVHENTDANLKFSVEVFINVDSYFIVIIVSLRLEALLEQISILCDTPIVTSGLREKIFSL